MSTKLCIYLLVLCFVTGTLSQNNNSGRTPTTQQGYPKYVSATTIFNTTCPRVRRSWYDISDADKKLYVSAIQALKKTGIWEQLTSMHNDNTNRQFAHGSQGFFVWHRYFLWVFENQLRALGPQYACLNIPYWPFEREAGQEGKGDVHKYFGGPNDVDNNLCVTFSSLKSWIVLDGGCLKRTFNTDYSYIGEARMLDLITSYPSYGNTAGFRSQIEGAPHAGVHNYIGGGGGQMGTMLSNSDPFFYLLHANIDRLFAIWEDCHDYDRLTGNIGGNSWPTSDANSAMPYLYNGRTHTLFTQSASGGWPLTPRNVYQIGTTLLPYLYDTNDRLVALMQTTFGSSSGCKFNWFNSLATTSTSTKAKRQNSGSDDSILPPRIYQSVNFTDGRVQQSYDSICTKEIPDATKDTQIHATAIAECDICTGHGRRKHASDEWIEMQNMENEREVFLPICSPEATNSSAYYGTGTTDGSSDSSDSSDYSGESSTPSNNNNDYSGESSNNNNNGYSGESSSNNNYSGESSSSPSNNNNDYNGDSSSSPSNNNNDYSGESSSNNNNGYSGESSSNNNYSGESSYQGKNNGGYSGNGYNKHQNDLDNDNDDNGYNGVSGRYGGSRFGGNKLFGRNRFGNNRFGKGRQSRRGHSLFF